jgi:hypothetical protein
LVGDSGLSLSRVFDVKKLFGAFLLVIILNASPSRSAYEVQMKQKRVRTDSFIGFGEGLRLKTHGRLGCLTETDARLNKTKGRDPNSNTGQVK